MKPSQLELGPNKSTLDEAEAILRRLAGPAALAKDLVPTMAAAEAGARTAKPCRRRFALCVREQ